MKPGHYALLLPALWIAAFVTALNGCGGEQAGEATVTEESALCAADNITSYPNAYNMDWHSPDGTSNSTSWNAVYIQLKNNACGAGYLPPSGVPTGTMRLFVDGGPVYSLYNGTWSGGHATWYVRDLQQARWFRFSCTFVRSHLWHCAMDASNGDGTWSGNGTIDLWQ